MRKLFYLLLLVLALSAVMVGRAGQSVTLAWNANSETNLFGYRLYAGPASRSYTNTVNVIAPTTTGTFTNLQPGVTYYFAVTAYTVDGLESDYSNEVSYQVPSPPWKANPVTNFWSRLPQLP